MKKFLQEFKTFAMRGNVIDMAVGVIIGGAFGKIVSSLVSDIIMPLIGVLIGGVDFQNLKWTFRSPSMGEGMPLREVTVNYGNFIQVTFDFLIIAFSIFLFVKLMARFFRKKATREAATQAAPAPVVTDEVKLLQEIRDLLKENARK